MAKVGWPGLDKVLLPYHTSSLPSLPLILHNIFLEQLDARHDLLPCPLPPPPPLQEFDEKGWTRFTPHYIIWICPTPYRRSEECNAQARPCWGSSTGTRVGAVQAEGPGDLGRRRATAHLPAHLPAPAAPALRAVHPQRALLLTRP